MNNVLSCVQYRNNSIVKTQSDRKILVRPKQNYCIAIVLVSVITICFILSDPDLYHWFIAPAFACGVLMGADFIRWLRGEIDPFDPKGLIGLILFHGWFLAPILHVFWGLTGYDLRLHGDPRPWLGAAALTNLIGIIFYKLSQRWSFRRTLPISSIRKFELNKFIPLILIAAVIGLFAQASFYHKYMIAMKMGSAAKDFLKGAGWLLMLGDSLPLLVSLIVIIPTPKFKRRRTWIIVGAMLIGIALTQFLWSGLRGSRGAFVGIMFYSTCLVHFWWRRLKAIHLFSVLALFLPFMYFYGFYKNVGAEAVDAFMSKQARQQLERKTRRTFPGMILGDLARADVQARICQVLVNGENDYRLRMGKTYLKSLTMPIPYAVWSFLIGDLSFKDKWDKGFAYYELVRGPVKKPGYYPKSTRIYALTGEAMLNFGFLGVVPAWCAFGWIMGLIRKKISTLPEHDARLLLVPMFTGVAMFTPIMDSTNIVFLVFKQGFVLLILLFACSKKIKI